MKNLYHSGRKNIDTQPVSKTSVITENRVLKNLYHSGRKTTIDTQPVSKTSVILTENRVLKFLQHSLNLIFFCSNRLFITVLWTVSLKKT